MDKPLSVLFQEWHRLNREKKEVALELYLRHLKLRKRYKATQIEFALDGNGYPTERTLEAIRLWTPRSNDTFEEDLDELLRGVASIWHWPEFAKRFDLPGGTYAWVFYTGGWSGNEELLAALSDNFFVTLQAETIDLVALSIICPRYDDIKLEIRINGKKVYPCRF